MLSTRMPDLYALQMLSAVHRLGSLSAAARELGVSQQAVSARMRALEGLAGVDLLTRSPRGARLTATGALVADWANDLLAAAERLDAGVASLRTDTARRLRVVASQTVAEHLLPPWLVTLRRDEEGVGRAPTAVELSVANSADASERVRSGAADLGFIESPNLPGDLAQRVVGRDELAVVVAPGHPWASRSVPLTPRELAATPLVTREVGSGTRDALEGELARIVPDAPAAAPAVELATSAAVRSAIAGGIAPGALSALAVRDDVQLGRLVRVAVEGLVLDRPITAIWRRARPPVAAARELLAIASCG
ncbi:LysR family transcriptional regulator [Microbacterium sp. STN6]|uniref:LysR family transcriptional regulator n=1 Tax=Microbacterium sp. STN6 TaxID=2995588 RepID=UPI002260B737|nr:LysR family transcriptional regulator [Microbacterium sp. STN6]MCX7521997.1 LysR family transcriptional regulator [Microbacterium sp. STN6]